MRIILNSDFCSFYIHIIIMIYIIFADEDWALGYENVPSYFSEFASRPHMQSRLPPQLLGAISRVQVSRPCWCS